MFRWFLAHLKLWQHWSWLLISCSMVMVLVLTWSQDFLFCSHHRWLHIAVPYFLAVRSAVNIQPVQSIQLVYYLCCNYGDIKIDDWCTGLHIPLHVYNYQTTAIGTIQCVDTPGASCQGYTVSPQSTRHSAQCRNQRAGLSVTICQLHDLPYVRTVYELGGRYVVRSNGVSFQQRWRTVSVFSEQPSNR